MPKVTQLDPGAAVGFRPRSVCQNLMLHPLPPSGRVFQTEEMGCPEARKNDMMGACEESALVLNAMWGSSGRVLPKFSKDQVRTALRIRLRNGEQGGSEEFNLGRSRDQLLLEDISEEVTSELEPARQV